MTNTKTAQAAPFRSSITPYLTVAGAAKAIAFYEQAFGAAVTMRIPMPDGKLGHAEIEISGAAIMLSDAFPEAGVNGPDTLGGTSVMLHLLVEDVDSAVERAVAAGATIGREVEDQFHGHRSGQILDPFGHKWDLATKLEDLTSTEVEARAAKLFGG